MVNCCNIVNCKNNSEDNPNLKYIRLPKDLSRCTTWLHLLGLADTINGMCLSNKIICSAHFTDDKNGGISFSNLKKSEVSTALQPSNRFKENNVMDRSVSVCGTCNSNFDTTDNSDKIKCATCSRLNHRLCVKINTEDYDDEIKNWKCEKCEALTKYNFVGPINLNFSGTLIATTKEELQETEILFLKSENKVLREQNEYLQNQVYSMEILMNRMKNDDNLNTQPKIKYTGNLQTTPINSKFEFFLLSEPESGAHDINGEAEITSDDLQENIRFEDEINVVDDVKIEYNESEAIIEDDQFLQDDHSNAIQEDDGENISAEAEITISGGLQENIIFEDEINVVDVKIEYNESETIIEDDQFLQDGHSNAIQEDEGENSSGKQFKNVCEGLPHLGNRTVRKRYICKICCKKYVRKDYFKAHMRSHTGEMPFACQICDAKFSFKSSLYQHVKNHSGEKPFKCNTCNKAFAQKGNLQGHLATHLGERFECGICNQKFFLRKIYQQHIKTHTDD